MSSGRHPRRMVSVLCGACLGLRAAAAAAAAPQSLYAGLDLALHAVRDDTLVPLAFSGPRLALVSRYFGELGPGLLVGDAQLGLGYALDREQAQAATVRWGLGASYLFVAYEGDWHLALGPAVGWDNETFLLADWDDAHAYWIGTLWLGPGLRSWTWLSDGWRLDLAGEVALLGWQSRPPEYRRHKQETSYEVLPYFGLPTRDLEFGGVTDWQLLRFSIELFESPALRRAPHGWGFGSELAWIHASEPAPAFAFSAALRVFYGFEL